MYYIYQTVKTFLILHKIYNIFNEMFQIPLNFVHQRILKKNCDFHKNIKHYIRFKIYNN